MKYILLEMLLGYLVIYEIKYWAFFSFQETILQLKFSLLWYEIASQNKCQKYFHFLVLSNDKGWNLQT